MKEVSLVEVSLDFSTAENIKIESDSSDGLTVRSTVPPYKSQVVAILRAYDVEWCTDCKVKVSKSSPSIQEQMTLIRDDLERISIEL